MKKTTVALLRNVRLAKVLPLFFAFFVVSAVQVNAQSFLPLDDALTQVQAEITDIKEDMMSHNTAQVTQLTAGEMQEAFNARYFTAFNNFAKEAQSLDDGLREVDELYDPQNPKPDQRVMIQTAREALLEIISE